MASWLKCTAKRDGAAVSVNLESAVSVYWSERDKSTIIACVVGERETVTYCAERSNPRNASGGLADPCRGRRAPGTIEDGIDERRAASQRTSVVRADHREAHQGPPVVRGALPARGLARCRLT